MEQLERVVLYGPKQNNPIQSQCLSVFLFMLKSRNLLASKTYYWFLPKNNNFDYVTTLFFDKDLYFYHIN